MVKGNLDFETSAATRSGHPLIRREGIALYLRMAGLEEMERIGRNVIDYEHLTGEVPDRTGWIPWLNFRYDLDKHRRDPWGSAYELGVTADSVLIISYGPDLIRATEDDFNFVTARVRQ